MRKPSSSSAIRSRALVSAGIIVIVIASNRHRIESSSHRIASHRIVIVLVIVIRQG
jgi:hypothetical protein